ncbi:MAG: hypothetical protein Ta2E_11950 [Mycoplasmoidaceae bacterium]|nr:MAG: hypothetical protein Ta2E_11950 [Mycoplasmoidaceae bacterium]
MKLNNTAQLFLKNDETKEFAKWLMNEEIGDRKIETEENGKYFFNWKHINGEGIKGRFHSLMSEAYKAANRIQIRIKYIEEEDKIRIWNEEDKRSAVLEKQQEIFHRFWMTNTTIT